MAALAVGESCLRREVDEIGVDRHPAAAIFASQRSSSASACSSEQGFLE